MVTYRLAYGVSIDDQNRKLQIVEHFNNIDPASHLIELFLSAVWASQYKIYSVFKF